MPYIGRRNDGENPEVAVLNAASTAASANALEDLFHTVWELEAWWDRDDAIDAAVRYSRQ